MNDFWNEFFTDYPTVIGEAARAGVDIDGIIEHMPAVDGESTEQMIRRFVEAVRAATEDITSKTQPCSMCGKETSYAWSGIPLCSMDCKRQAMREFYD